MQAICKLWQHQRKLRQCSIKNILLLVFKFTVG